MTGMESLPDREKPAPLGSARPREVGGSDLSEALYRDATDIPAPDEPVRRRKAVDSGSRVREAPARCLIGRAPWRDALVGLGAPRVGATLEWGDLRPFISNLIH